MGIIVLEKREHILAKFRLGSLMSLIDDYHIVFGGKDSCVLIVLASCQLSATKVLH
ncbi:unknown [Alistipes sp. CAG:514]|nr:unknown [Alistipes sp. CAG:514]